MSSPEPLLAAVGADPADDRARLAFAAWAEEHGEPERAELIRLQVGLPAAVDGGDPAWPEAHERAVRLLAANEAAWAGPLAPFVGEGRVSFERGFVASVGVTDETWCADWPERLGLADWQIGAAALEPLAAGRLPRLRQLDLADVACGDGGAIALAGAACAPHLRELVLPGCGITDVGAEALRGADFRRLEWLLLKGNPIGAEAEARLRARFGGRLTYARAWP